MPQKCAKKTIALCCNSTYAMLNFRGGVIRQLIAAGHRVVIVAPVDGHSHELKAMGAEQVEWNLLGKSTNVLSEIAAVRDLYTIYSQVMPDAAFHYTIKPVIYGALVCRLRRIPFISVITGLGYAFINDGLIAKIAKIFYKVTLRWSKEIWLLNGDDQQTMLSGGLVAERSVRILPGEGVNTTYFSPREMMEAKRPRFLLIARLLRDKGVFEYIEAARELLREGVEAEFALLGASDADNPTAITSEMVRKWESDGIVKYLGTCRDVRPFIDEAQCLVLPSYREGLPRSLLEAAAMARPVIATDVPGCRDVVIDGQTGFLCRARDVNSLTNAIKKFLSLSLGERRDLGKRGRQFVCEQFDEKFVIERYAKALENLLKSPE